MLTVAQTLLKMFGLTSSEPTRWPMSTEADAGRDALRRCGFYQRGKYGVHSQEM